MKTEGSIKAQQSFEGPSRPLQLQPPAKGNHRLAKVQIMYEDVSRFLSDQTWRTPKEETRASGTTWLELFILYDTMGYRRREGRTPKHAGSAVRSDERKAKNKHQRKGRRSVETSEPRASLAEELEAFKKVVRHTTRQDGDAEQAKWFHGDAKPQYRRLKGLGITEHQPAIAANCEVDPITMLEIEEAIITQKARCTAKQLKHFKDERQKVEEVGAFLIRKSKVDVRSCPNWKRVECEGTEIRKDEYQEHAFPSPPPGQAYKSRLISCPVCKEQVQTAMMQLLTPLGFRYVSCSGCEKQRWSRGWLCECGVAWHTCATHRKDPAIHMSAKPPKRTADKAKTECRYRDSERPAPEAVQSVNFQPKKRANGYRTIHAHGTVSHDPSLPQDDGPKITEDWKRRIDENRKRGEEPAEEDFSYAELQMDLVEIIDDDEQEQQRDRPGGGCTRWDQTPTI